MKGCSLADLAFNLDLTIVRLDDSVDNGQTEPGSPFFGAGGKERLEENGLHRDIDATGSTESERQAFVQRFISTFCRRVGSPRTQSASSGRRVWSWTPLGNVALSLATVSSTSG